MTVTFCAALVVVKSWPLKVSDVGAGVATAAAAAAVPVRARVCGLPGALSESERVPVRGFVVEVGVNVTLIVQVAFTITVVLLHVFVCAKSPEMLTAEAPKYERGVAGVLHGYDLCGACRVDNLAGECERSRRRSDCHNRSSGNGCSREPHQLRTSSRIVSQREIRSARIWRCSRRRECERDEAS